MNPLSLLFVLLNLMLIASCSSRRSGKTKKRKSHKKSSGAKKELKKSKRGGNEDFLSEKFQDFIVDGFFNSKSWTDKSSSWESNASKKEHERRKGSSDILKRDDHKRRPPFSKKQRPSTTLDGANPSKEQRGGNSHRDDQISGTRVSRGREKVQIETSAIQHQNFQCQSTLSIRKKRDEELPSHLQFYGSDYMQHHRSTSRRDNPSRNSGTPLVNDPLIGPPRNYISKRSAKYTGNVEDSASEGKIFANQSPSRIFKEKNMFLNDRIDTESSQGFQKRQFPSKISQDTNSDAVEHTGLCSRVPNSSKHGTRHTETGKIDIENGVKDQESAINPEKRSHSKSHENLNASKGNKERYESQIKPGDEIKSLFHPQQRKYLHGNPAEKDPKPKRRILSRPKKKNASNGDDSNKTSHSKTKHNSQSDKDDPYEMVKDGIAPEKQNAVEIPSNPIQKIITFFSRKKSQSKKVQETENDGKLSAPSLKPHHYMRANDHNDSDLKESDGAISHINPQTTSYVQSKKI